MDTVSRETRSWVMSRVKSRRNRSTEWRLRAGFVRAGLTGWRLDPGGLPGNPDFVFPEGRVAIFVDGCFWHGCPKCGREPSSNVEYWNAKIRRNRRRDRRVSAQLRRRGWRVVRVWEHQLKKLGAVVGRIRNAVAGSA